MIRTGSGTGLSAVVRVFATCLALALVLGASIACTAKTEDTTNDANSSIGATGDTVERETCFANQRTIDGAAAAYVAEKGTAPTTMTQLVQGGQLKVAPTCPATGQAYTLSGGVVAACSVHGHY
ncbi:MAG: hypothetical protein EG823_07260 [Actinobacteria bacterium]|nr:hypothetical protein [Actinomycetota bacterium]